MGNETARQWLAAYGLPQAIFEADPDALSASPSERLRRAIETVPEALPALLASTLDWLAQGQDRCIVTLGDAHYPASLLNIADPPLMLYMMGSLVPRPEASASQGLAGMPCLAIVGSRNPTPQGQINATQFAQALSAAGWCVVSGLAMGVDGAAHEGALHAGGSTVAVVGTGLDRVYPRKHLALAHRIAARGLIVSEFALGTPPLTANFPRRNRLIAGLSQGTLVIEAAPQSGSLITARLAAEQGKEVFAIPGSIHSPLSRGCHLLIKQGAKLVESAQDVLEELPALPGKLLRPEMDGADRPPDGTPALDVQPDPPLLRALGFDPASLDELQARTGLATAALQAQLLELEMGGDLARLPGGKFVRIAKG
ncbi:MAG: DNA-processing protein DprA [Polaromonas sp.]|nr:DNA-processing protein DprA [Polaromonas sp.]